MLGLTPETRVFVKTGATDLRLAFEGLRALVINVIHRDPCSGFVFAFCIAPETACAAFTGMGAGYGLPRSGSSLARWTGLRMRRELPR